jgi:hypothetical protein
MKSRRLTRIIAMTLFALAIPVAVAAQDNATQNHKAKHHHYQLFDMGTLGGPISPPHSAEQSTCGGIVPSDHALSSSPTYLVQVVNACIIVLKASSGAKVSGYPKSLNTFFGAPAADGLGDSRTAYDSLENRFIVTVVGGRTSRFEEAS